MGKGSAATHFFKLAVSRAVPDCGPGATDRPPPLNLNLPFALRPFGERRYPKAMRLPSKLVLGLVLAASSAPAASRRLQSRRCLPCCPPEKGTRPGGNVPLPGGPFAGGVGGRKNNGNKGDKGSKADKGSKGNKADKGSKGDRDGEDFDGGTVTAPNIPQNNAPMPSPPNGAAELDIPPGSYFGVPVSNPNLGGGGIPPPWATNPSFAPPPPAPPIFSVSDPGAIFAAPMPAPPPPWATGGPPMGAMPGGPFAGGVGGGGPPPPQFGQSPQFALAPPPPSNPNLGRPPGAPPGAKGHYDSVGNWVGYPISSPAVSAPPPAPPRPPGSHGIAGRPPEGPLRRSRELGGLSHLPSRRLGSASPSPLRHGVAELLRPASVQSEPRYASRGASAVGHGSPPPSPGPGLFLRPAPEHRPTPAPPLGGAQSLPPRRSLQWRDRGGYHEHHPPRLRGKVVLCGVARYGGLHRRTPAAPSRALGSCDRYRHFRQEQDEERQVRE